MQTYLIHQNPFDNRFKKILSNVQAQLLNAEISYSHRKTIVLRNDLELAKEQVRSNTSSQIFDSYSNSQGNAYRNLYYKTKKRQMKKLEKLVNTQK